jgi:hypothetical protein
MFPATYLLHGLEDVGFDLLFTELRIAFLHLVQEHAESLTGLPAPGAGRVLFIFTSRMLQVATALLAI